jgi:hypothetical protein
MTLQRTKWMVWVAIAAISCGEGAGDSDVDAGLAIDLGCREESAGTDRDTDAPFDMDCREELVDSFWGEAPAEEDRIAIFDDLWGTAARQFAGFAQVDAD